MELVGFEHLHLHTDFSLLDGYGMVEEYAARATKINQNYLCISDHGMMAAIPRQIRACDEHHLKPIFACELYLNPLQMELKADEDTGDYVKKMPDEEKKLARKSYHLLAIAYNEIGYKNLVSLSSWAWTKGFYYKPRVNYEILQEKKEGLFFSTACYNSEIGCAFDVGGEDAAMQKVLQYQQMFGDKLFLEMMLLDFSKQRAYNQFIIKAHQQTGIPIILTNDTHYAEQADSYMQRMMLLIQTKRTLAALEEEMAKAASAGELADFFELQDQNLWMKSEAEINEKWEKDYQDIPYEIFKQAKLNTVEVCKRAAGVQLDRSIKLPQIEDADGKLKQYIIDGFQQRKLPKTQEYLDKIKEEYELITRKEFSTYFLLEKMMVDEGRRWWGTQTNGGGRDAVAPGRGSAAGSLVAYCLGITDTDPVKHDLLFSRFLNPSRGGKSMKLRFKAAKTK